MTDKLAPSLPPVEAQLRALIAKWRHLESVDETGLPHGVIWASDCADDLEKLIESLPSPDGWQPIWRSVFTNEVIRAIGALARQQNVCREQAGQVVFVTGMEAAREYIVEQLAIARSSPENMVRHGVNCPKVKHLGGGYLHHDDDDRPYDVDGSTYCGRCHFILSYPAVDAPAPRGGTEEKTA